MARQQVIYIGALNATRGAPRSLDGGAGIRVAPMGGWREGRSAALPVLRLAGPATPFGLLPTPARRAEAQRDEGLRLGHFRFLGGGAGWGRAGAELLRAARQAPEAAARVVAKLRMPVAGVQVQLAFVHILAAEAVGRQLVAGETVAAVAFKGALRDGIRASGG